MAQQPRDRRQVLTRIEHMFGKGMPQDMRGHLLKPSPTGELADDQLHPVGLQRLSPLTNEQMVIATYRPYCQVRFHCLAHVMVQRNSPLLIALAAHKHASLALGDADVAQAQITQLTHPNAGVPKQMHDGEVPLVPCLLRLTDQPVNIALGEGCGHSWVTAYTFDRCRAPSPGRQVTPSTPTVSVSLDPNTGQAGSSVSINATGFPSSAYLRAVYILFDNTSLLNLYTLGRCTASTMSGIGFTTADRHTNHYADHDTSLRCRHCDQPNERPLSTDHHGDRLSLWSQ
jgi:hypothetical protein